ncbi:hypothetical protein CDD83_1847 [Cordyceps sp. RAO-2017]|nr:hypothetical protein CDD83_1847 [Cordyceps sp. RAO-2017]
MGSGSRDVGHIIEAASAGLLQAYLDEPEAWYAHNFRYLAAVMHRLLTNTPLDKSRAELEALQRVTSTFVGAINTSFVEFFPALERLPRVLQLWRSSWEKVGTFHHDVFKAWWATMAPVTDPGAGSSFVRDVILSRYSGGDERAAYLTMMSMSAGADNPRMTMNAWVMACLVHPAAMQRARDEIERVCGTDADRLPTLYLPRWNRVPY